jgi:predicted alpha/beta superfamily hydrolase
MSEVLETPAATAAEPAKPVRSPVKVPFSVQFDMASQIAGRTYRIFVFAPLGPPPPEGYAVIFTSDGNLTFPVAAVVNGMMSMGGAKKAVVVSIGYPTDNPMQMGLLRRRDLTPPTPLAAIRPTPGWPEPTLEDFGGAEAFFGFITEELRPAIAAEWPINPADQTLYGHSLGGLFALHALFNHPEAFRNFVASSPSIWWNDRAILKDEVGFARCVEAGDAAPRVLITIGATEQDGMTELPPGYTQEAADKLIVEARMVDNAAELGARLAALSGPAGYEARYRALHEDDHTTALATSIARAITFALRG